MKVHLVDGTYELFRCYFGAPARKTSQGKEVGATRGLLRSLASWLNSGEVTHVAYAFDHVIESFRNDLFNGYKTGEGIDPDLYGQFELAERAVRALGVVVWPMQEFEADDAIATAAKRFSSDKSVVEILLCTPDKDLTQCVQGDRIVMWDRFKKVRINEKGVVEKFGVSPPSIPDYLALVGDTADGIPGVPRWGAKSAASLLAAYSSIENIPSQTAKWTLRVRGAASLSDSLEQYRTESKLYKRLATLRYDAPLNESLSDLQWKGADRSELEDICNEVEDLDLLKRVNRWRS